MTNSAADVDVNLLQQSGAAPILHSLTEQVLAIRPSDPVRWMQEQIQSHRFYLSPTHLTTILASAHTLNPSLLLHCLVDFSLTHWEVYQNFYGGGGAEEANIVSSEVETLVLAAATSLSEVWTTSEVTAAQATLEAKAVAAPSDKIPFFANAVLDLALARKKVCDVMVARRTAAAAALAAEAAAAQGDGTPRTEEKIEEPSKRGKGKRVSVAPAGGVATGAAKVNTEPVHVSLMVPFARAGPLLAVRAGMLHRHLSWAVEPMGDTASVTTWLVHNPTPGDVDREDHHPVVAPKEVDVARFLLKQAKLGRHVQVSQSIHGVAGAVLEVQAKRNVDAKAKEFAGMEGSGDWAEGNVNTSVPPTAQRHVVICTDGVHSAIHAGSLSQLVLPLLEAPLSVAIQKEEPPAAEVSSPTAPAEKTAPVAKGKKGKGAAAAEAAPPPPPAVTIPTIAIPSASWVATLQSPSARLFYTLTAPIVHADSMLRNLYSGLHIPAIALHGDVAVELARRCSAAQGVAMEGGGVASFNTVSMALTAFDSPFSLLLASLSQAKQLAAVIPSVLSCLNSEPSPTAVAAQVSAYLGAAPAFPRKELLENTPPSDDKLKPQTPESIQALLSKHKERLSTPSLSPTEAIDL